MLNETISNSHKDFGDVYKVVYKRYIDALVQTLAEYHADPRSYTLFGMRDDSECLVENDDAWTVFYFERGIKHELKEYDDIEDACCEILGALAKSNDEEIGMKYRFTELQNTQDKQKVSLKALKSALRKIAVF